jgi:hypothetical protein
LEIFGPKIVMLAQGTAAGLACAAATVEISSDEGSTGAICPDACARLRDALYHWAMETFSGLRDKALGLGASRVLPLLTRELFGAAATLVHSDGAEQPAAATVAVPVEASPKQLMEDVLAGCAGGTHLSLMQIMLEIALRGGDGDALSPERVGRWLSSHPKVDAHRPVERRRLYGQISRIYPLVVRDEEAGDAIDAFEFCKTRECRGCRYEQVCPVTFPELRRRKQLL